MPVEMSRAVKQAMERERQALAAVPDTIDALRRHKKWTLMVLADAMDQPYSWVQERVSGKRSCSMSDLAGFAVVFGVTIEVLRMAPDDALRWVLDNPDGGPTTVNGPTVGSREMAAQAA